MLLEIENCNHRVGCLCGSHVMGLEGGGDVINYSGWVVDCNDRWQEDFDVGWLIRNDVSCIVDCIGGSTVCCSVSFNS